MDELLKLNVVTNVRDTAKVRALQDTVETYYRGLSAIDMG